MLFFFFKLLRPLTLKDISVLAVCTCHIAVVCVRLQCLALLAVATAYKQVSTHVIWKVNKNIAVEGFFPLRALKIH